MKVDITVRHPGGSWVQVSEDSIERTNAALADLGFKLVLSTVPWQRQVGHLWWKRWEIGEMPSLRFDEESIEIDSFHFWDGP